MIGVSSKRSGGGQRLMNYLVGIQFICIFTEVKLEVLLAFDLLFFIVRVHFYYLIRF